MKENHRIFSTGKHGGGRVRFGGRIPVNMPDEYYDDKIVGGFHTNRRSVFTHHVRGKGYGSYSHKWINRWLQKQVGRKWDDVYSEICAEFDNRSYKGWYVREFMVAGRWRDIVDQRTFVDEQGEVRSYGGYSLHQEFRHPKADGLYVHPVTRILCHRELSYNEKWDIVHEKKVIDQIGVNSDGSWRVISVSPRHYPYYRMDYRKPECTEWFALEECGRSPKNRFKAWFHYTHREQRYEYFCPISQHDLEFYERCTTDNSSWNRDYGKTLEQILTERGYFLRDSHGIPVWGKMQTSTERISSKRSCNNKQLARIKRFLALAG